jgi:hypothetical protein
MADRNLFAHQVGPSGENPHLRTRDLEKALYFSEPSVEKVYLGNYYQSGLTSLSYRIERDNGFTAFMAADQSSAIMLQNGFSRILLVTLQFAVKLYRYRVYISPSVDHPARDLVSFAKFEKLVQESSWDEIAAALLFHAAYLSRDVADPFTTVVPHFIVRVRKNKPLEQFSFENARQTVDRYFDPLCE